MILPTSLTVTFVGGLGYSAQMIHDNVLKGEDWEGGNRARGLDFECSAQGYDTNGITFNVCNRRERPAKFHVPRGAMLSPECKSQQNLVVRDEVSGNVPPRSTMSFSAYGFCGNAERGSPSGTFFAEPARLTTSLANQREVWAVTSSYRRDM